MAGVDTVLRLIGATMALVVIPFVAAVGYAIMDPIYNNVITPSLFTGLGWGAPQKVIMLFAGLAFIGLTGVVIVWWIVSPAREDVRQGLQNRGPF